MSLTIFRRCRTNAQVLAQRSIGKPKFDLTQFNQAYFDRF